MIIKASRIRIFGCLYFALFVFSALFLIALSLAGKNEFSIASQMNILITAVTISFFVSLVQLLAVKYDVEISSDGDMIGGALCGRIYLRKQFFVNKKNIDNKRSSERNFYDRIIGQYKIYGQNGRCFKVNKYFYNVQNFVQIKNKLSEVLGVEIDQKI